MGAATDLDTMAGNMGRPQMRFRTKILRGGKTATGIRVPDEIVEALSKGRRPPVKITINGFTYRNMIAVMGGDYMVGVSAENRVGARIAGGDEGETRIRAAYPGKTWDRLAEIKARYDPTNLFRLNQNVPPATGAG